MSDIRFRINWRNRWMRTERITTQGRFVSSKFGSRGEIERTFALESYFGEQDTLFQKVVVSEPSLDPESAPFEQSHSFVVAGNFCFGIKNNSEVSRNWNKVQETEEFHSFKGLLCAGFCHKLETWNGFKHMFVRVGAEWFCLQWNLRHGWQCRSIFHRIFFW